MLVTCSTHAPRHLRAWSDPQYGRIDDTCADLYGHLTLLSVSLTCNTVAGATVENLEDFIRDMSNGQFVVVSNVEAKKK